MDGMSFINWSKHIWTWTIQATNGVHKKPVTPPTIEETKKEEAPKKVVRPVTSKPAEKPSVVKSTEDSDDKKPVTANGPRVSNVRVTATPVKPKKEEVTGEDDKKSEGEVKKEEKKPTTSTPAKVSAVKKPVEKKEETATEKDDKKPVKPVVEKKPVIAPTPKVTKKEPEVKKEEIKTTVPKRVEPKKDEHAKPTPAVKNTDPKKPATSAVSYLHSPLSQTLIINHLRSPQPPQPPLKLLWRQ